MLLKLRRGRPQRERRTGSGRRRRREEPLLPADGLRGDAVAYLNRTFLAVFIDQIYNAVSIDQLYIDFYVERKVNFI